MQSQGSISCFRIGCLHTHSWENRESGQKHFKMVVRGEEIGAAERYLAQLDDQKLVAAQSSKEVVGEAEISLRPTTSHFWLQDAQNATWGARRASIARFSIRRSSRRQSGLRIR